MNANDHVPMVHILPFGFCKKGMPCMPLTPLAWVDVNKKHIIEGAPALTEDSKLACFHGGVISIVPLDAGSAEEGDRNENAGGVVENIALALGIVGGILLNTNVALAKNLMKTNGKKSIVKSVKGGVNKGKGSNAAGFEKDISKLSSGERVASVKGKAKEVAGQNGWKKDPILSKKNGRDIYRDPKTKEIYSVDTQHGRFEKCDPKTGRHSGEFDIDLKQTKPADASGSHDIIVK